MPRWQAKLSDGRTAILEADEQPSESDVLSALDTQVAEQDLGAGIAESARLPRRILSTLTSPLAGMASEMGREQGAAARDTRRAGFIGSLGPPAPAGTVGKVMEPFVRIPRADADDPRFKAFLTGALRRPPTEEAASTAAALVNTGAGLVEGVESPAGVATMGAGTLGPAAGKLAALAWGAYMAKQVPEEARRAGEASVTGTPQERKEAYLGLGTTIATPAMIGAGLVPKESPARGLARELGRAEPTLPDVESESAKGPLRAEIQPEERRAPPPDMVKQLADRLSPILPKAAAEAKLTRAAAQGLTPEEVAANEEAIQGDPAPKAAGVAAEKVKPPEVEPPKPPVAAPELDQGEAEAEKPIRLVGNKKTAPWPSALISKDPTGKGWRLTWFSEFEGKLEPRGHEDFPTRESADKAAKEMDFEEAPTPAAPPKEPAPPTRDWDLFNENLRDDLDAFSPARTTGKVDYDLMDVADRFVEYAKADKSGKSLDKLVSDFAKTDEASQSQIRKLRQSVKSVLSEETPTTPTPQSVAKASAEVQQVALTEGQRSAKVPASVHKDPSGKPVETSSPETGRQYFRKDPDSGQWLRVRYDGVSGRMDQHQIHEWTWLEGPQKGSKSSQYGQEGFFAAKSQVAEPYIPEHGTVTDRFRTEQELRNVRSQARTAQGNTRTRLNEKARLLNERLKQIDAYAAAEEAKRKSQQPPPATGEGMAGPGPGAQTPGEPPYPAISQLTDRLKATPSVGLKDSIPLKERVAEEWARGKSQVSRAVAKMRAVTESLKETVRGVRTPTDLDRKVGEFDWAIQSSAGHSKQAGAEIARQMRSENTRNAVALWIDAGGDEALLKDALDRLPAGTSPSIRRALEESIRLSPESKQFAQDLKQFFSLREQDATQHELFEQGLKDYYTHIWEKESNMPDELRAAFVNGRLSTYFKFGRERKIPMFIQGILAGKKPVLDPSKVIPFYNYAMDRAIASRQFIKDASEVVMPDGRPLLSPSGLRSVIEQGDTPEALIIRPKARSEQNADYHQVDHPALRKWKWAGTGEHGEPILYQGDLLVHPEGFTRLANMMDRGRLTPTKWGGRLLRASTEVKAFKLGLLSAFHNVHVGSHAAFHWTNPFKALGKPIDWDAPETRFAVEKGHLKIAPDPAELRIAAEGIMGPGLVHKLPIIGPISKAWSEWTFGEMIPQLKLRTFENAYQRNLWARENMPLSGLKGLTDEEIASRVGDSVNNAFGELNHLFLGKYGRNPQFQRLLRGIFLAPDFGEARLRFVEKAFTKSGFEERLALATMFTTLYLGARVANWLSHGDPEWDWKRAFQVKHKDHWWSMRSVVGDVDHAAADFGRFMYVRLNPLYSRTAADFLFGRDVSGRKLSTSEKIGNVFKQLVPIQMGGLTRPDQRLWESFVSSMGLSAQRDRPEQDIRRAVTQWMSKSTDPKIQQKFQQSEGEVFSQSVYAPLRFALEAEDYGKANEEYQKLLKVRKPGQVREYLAKDIRTMGGLSVAEFHKFQRDMTPEQKKLLEQAKAHRREIYQRYLKMINKQE